MNDKMGVCSAFSHSSKEASALRVGKRESSGDYESGQTRSKDYDKEGSRHSL